MRQFAILIAATSLAGNASAQAPTPPVAPPIPEAGAAQPMTQAKPKDIAASPGTSADKPPAWDVAARHGPGRDVAIDTTSGTWMSLDVSPDGREIAFDLLGDLYVVPISGGEARAISTGHAWRLHRRFSDRGTT